VTLDRESLNSECLSGCLVRRLFNCWIYFTTYAYLAIVYVGGQKVGFWTGC